ncbi:MAG: glycosyltransferase [Gemmatimonadota bacterium]|nr:glycosyltransferase [Gemmatimonadota bacterium]
MPFPTAHAHSAAEHLDAPVIVHSHLRWDFVWQRPQQLLSRLGRTNRVLFVEEPVYLDDYGLDDGADGLAAARLDLSVPQPHVHRVVPVLPGSLRGHYDDSIVVIRELLHRQLDDGVLGKLFRRPVQWFYTPMPAPAMIAAFGERAVVYDCMDELSKFRFAPTELTDRESYLMSKADVVFTGGYRLWESKAQHHGNVHFFGCGVDVAHFGSSMCDSVEVPTEIARLGRPVMGYYGVIDERIDYDLLRTLAESLPDTALVMVGPVVKVDPRELPQAPNIHWLGQRDYAALPAHVKGFDVCLMPFALNEATEYINPTKTLEYMAAGKPIVSTAISDVVHHFRPVVAVAHSHAEFVSHVRSALEAPDEALIERGLEQARGSSWECIVADMAKIMRAAIAARTVVLNEVKDPHVQSQVQVIRSAQDDNALAAASTRAKRHPARTQALALSEATGT